MKTNTELYGKFQIVYRPTNKGCTIGNIEKIDKFTDLHESGENRYDLKVEIVDNVAEAIDFVYQQKKYISRDAATEIVAEFLN